MTRRLTLIVFTTTYLYLATTQDINPAFEVISLLFVVGMIRLGRLLPTW